MHRSIKKTAKAFTLLEVLLSMAILAALMAAVGLAFDASAKNYTQNEAMFKAMSNARQSLIRVTTDIRTSAFVDTIGGTYDIDNKMCSKSSSPGTALQNEWCLSLAHLHSQTRLTEVEQTSLLPQLLP